MSKLYDFKSVYALAQTLYNANLDPGDFEDVGMVAGTRINNKHTRLHRYVSDTKCRKIELPCNVDIIESVHIPIADAQITSPNTVFYSVETLFIENYVEAGKRLDSPMYQRGKLVKYHEGDNELEFSSDYKKVMIVYHGIIADETGLPKLTDKERDAIAAYIGYTDLYKKAIQFRDKNLMEIALLTKQDGLRLCNAARIPEHFSQNDMDAILDVKTRGDRKAYGKSMKPIL